MIRAHREAIRAELELRYGAPKHIVYKRLVSSGYYLPPINSPAVTRDYLKGVDEDYFLRVSVKDLKQPQARVICTKREVYLFLLETSEVKLGFEILNLPSKKWMLNVLYTLKPDHPLFISPPIQENLLRSIGNREIDVLAELKRIYNDLKTVHQQEKERLRDDNKMILELAIRQRMRTFKNKYPFSIINF